MREQKCLPLVQSQLLVIYRRSVRTCKLQLATCNLWVWVRERLPAVDSLVRTHCASNSCSISLCHSFDTPKETLSCVTKCGSWGWWKKRIKDTHTSSLSLSLFLFFSLSFSLPANRSRQAISKLLVAWRGEVHSSILGSFSTLLVHW